MIIFYRWKWGPVGKLGGEVVGGGQELGRGFRSRFVVFFLLQFCVIF